MLYSYEEFPNGLDFVGAVEVSIKFDYKVAIIKVPYYMQYVGILLLHSSLVFLNIYIYIYTYVIFLYNLYQKECSI